MYLQSLISWLGRSLWGSAPFLFVVVLILCTMAPIRAFGGQIPPPNFAVIAVFFWAIYAPQLLPPVAVFLIGVVMDLVGSGPIGLWPLMLLTLYGVTLSQRDFFMGRSVFGVWAGFGLFAVATSLTGWAVASIFTMSWVDPWPIALETTITLLAFPIAGRVFMMLRRMLTSAPERSY